MGLAIIGHSKCGTVSISKLFEDNGYPVYRRTGLNLDNFKHHSNDKFLIDHPYAVPTGDIKRISEVCEYAVMIFRDPIDIAVSMYGHIRRGMSIGEKRLIVDHNDLFLDYYEPIFKSLSDGGTMNEFANYNYDFEQNYRHAKELFGDKLLIIRFEDLTRFPKRTMDFLTNTSMGIELDGSFPNVNIGYSPKSDLVYQITSFLLHKLTGLNTKRYVRDVDEGGVRASLFTFLYNINKQNKSKILSKKEIKLLKNRSPYKDNYSFLKSIDTDR